MFAHGAFSRGAVLAAILVAAPIAMPTAAAADDLDVTIYEYGGDGLPSCATSTVAGLKSRDSFLAVRSGPGSDYRELDRLYNGDVVVTFDQQGAWIGVMYGGAAAGCQSPDKKRPLPYAGKKGWVHGNWLRDLAG